jgi:ribosomal protein L21
MAETKAKTTTKKSTKPAKKASSANSNRVAVIQINNMQYVAKEGSTFPARISPEAKLADLDVKLLAIVDTDSNEFSYGTPHLSNKLDLSLGEMVKGDKVVSKTYKAKSRTRRKVGFRPKFVEVTVNSLG